MTIGWAGCSRGPSETALCRFQLARSADGRTDGQVPQRSRRAVPMRHTNTTRWWMVSLIVSVSGLAETDLVAQQPPRRAADHFAASRPENIKWGWFPIDAPPVLTLKSGQTVRIDTLSQAGATQEEHPAAFLEPYGVGRDEILQRTSSISGHRKPTAPGSDGGAICSPARSTSKAPNPGTCSRCRSSK